MNPLPGQLLLGVFISFFLSLTIIVADEITDLAVYDFEHQPGNQAEQSASRTFEGVTASPLQRGEGLDLPPPSTGTFSAARWSTDQDQFAYNDYLEFTIAPAAGTRINLQALQFWASSNAKGPRAFTIRSSLDNFTTDLVPHIPLDPDVPASEHTIQLGTEFQGIDFPVTFRFYAYGTRSSTSGFWGLGRINDSGFLKVLGSIENSQHPVTP